MNITPIKRLLLAGGLAFSATTLAAPSAEMLANTCAACHGTNGNSVAATPSLAGTSADYFVETMQAFKDGTRKATVMDRIAKGYTDEELAAMAGYFAAQKPVPMQQAYTPVKANLGKQLHQDYCEKCHEEGGRAAEDAAPLAGQSMLYLSYSMEDFHAGHREAPKKMARRVREMFESHGQAGIEALMHYYAAQQ